MDHDCIAFGLCLQQLYEGQRKKKQFVFHGVKLALCLLAEKVETTNIW